MYVYDHHLKRATNKFQSYPAISFSTHLLVVARNPSLRIRMSSKV